MKVINSLSGWHGIVFEAMSWSGFTPFIVKGCKRYCKTKVGPMFNLCMFNPNNRLYWKTGYIFFFLLTTGLAAPAMEKYVTEQATFVVYMPKGWTAKEGVQPGYRTLAVTDPDGLCQAAMFYGNNPAANPLALSGLFIQAIKRQYPDLQVRDPRKNKAEDEIVFDGTYTDPKKGKKEFRCWISGRGGAFTFSSIEAPEGQLAKKKQLLLTILANVQVIKGASWGIQPVRVPMVRYRLRDGSASFMIPRDWTVQEFGTGHFAARDPSGLYSFVVASVEVFSPRLGVNVPGAVYSEYRTPHQALKILAERQGAISNMNFDEVIPRPDISRMIGQVYTLGPVTTEEFTSRFVTRNTRCKGYSLGVCLGSRLGINWRFWHMSVGTPASKFDPFVSNFVTMMQSYKIDDKFAMNYIARGMARVRQMQQETAAMVARNARDIHDMMQAAYDERQKSMEYIDYQRTNYIRGQQDWISGMEGGSVYHSDAWGTQNTATGEYHEGAPYNYFNFTGQNPKYAETMTPINDRAAWQKTFNK
jgi:hypothetical protein